MRTRPSPAGAATAGPTGMSLPATYEDVTRLLGDIDPLLVERILSTGATADEIDEALRASQDELGFGEESHAPSSPCVASVRAVVDELTAEAEERGEDDARA